MMNVQILNGILEQKEIDAYAEMAKDKYGDKLVGLKIEIENDDEVTLSYILKNDCTPKMFAGKIIFVPFERIRRITGYLVGTLDKWNDAKRAEERDRVKHTVNQDLGNNA